MDIANRRGRKKVADLLIANGADVSLHAVAGLGLLERLKELIAKGMDINAPDALGRTALHHAAGSGKKEIVELLLENGSNVNAKDNGGLTVLRMAMIRYRAQIAKMLVDKGAEVPNIHLAASVGDLAKAKLFIQKGIDVSELDANRRTPLHYAATVDVAEFLIAQGCDIHAEDKDGETPLHTTAASGCKDVVELLLTKGADVHAKKSGYTPLYWAV